MISSARIRTWNQKAKLVCHAWIPKLQNHEQVKWWLFKPLNLGAACYLGTDMWLHPLFCKLHLVIYSKPLAFLWFIECVPACTVIPDSCDSVDCSLPGSTVHEIIQARILEWVAVSFSSGSFQFKDWTHVSCISCNGFFTPEPPGNPWCID